MTPGDNPGRNPGDAWATIDRLLAVGPAEADVEGVRRTLADPGPDWVKVISLANAHFVGPALWSRLAAADASAALPDDVRSYLLLLHSQNAERNERIRHQCLEVGERLARAGLQAVLLKGAAWLFDGSDDARADRMMRDIDLLCAPRDAAAAVSALVAGGYRDTAERFVEIGHYHHAPLISPEGEAAIELHHDLAHQADLLRPEEVIASAKSVAPGLLLPAPGHRIVHNVVHAQIENGDWIAGVFNLRDGLDLARLVARSEHDVDWAALAAQARERGYVHMLSGALQAAHRTLRSPLPAPLATDARGRFHAWRCVHQRRWHRLGRLFEAFGRLTRALAWQRDAYGLKLTSRWSLRAQLLVNLRRFERARAALGQLKFRRSHDAS